MSMTEKLSRKVEVLVAWLFVALLSCGLYAAPAYADLNEAGDSGFSESESGAGTNEPKGSWRVDSHGWWYELANGSYPSPWGCSRKLSRMIPPPEVWCSRTGEIRPPAGAVRLPILGQPNLGEWGVFSYTRYLDPEK